MVDVAAPGRQRDPMAYVRRQVFAALQDSTTPRSVRWEFARFTWDMPCFNARELVFGPGEEQQAALERFRKTTLVTPGDSALFRVLTSENFPARAPVRQIVAVFAGILGNPRLADCARLTVSGL